LTPTVAIWVLLCQTGLAPTFVIFDIRALMLRVEHQSARMSKIANVGANPVWHRMLYTFTAVPIWQQRVSKG